MSNSTSVQRPVERWSQEQGVTATQDLLAEEVPVALVYGGISYAVMMATPDSLQQFAL